MTAAATAAAAVAVMVTVVAAATAVAVAVAALCHTTAFTCVAQQKCFFLGSRQHDV